MAERADKTIKNETAFSRLFWWPFEVLKWIFYSLAGSIILEWILMTVVWYEQGAKHSEQILANEWRYIKGAETQPVWGLKSPTVIAINLTTGMDYWLLQWTGIEFIFTSIGKIGTLVQEYIIASLNVARIFLLRLAIAITSMPLFILFAFWGFIEGLIDRDLRKFGGDIEHGLLYHYGKYITKGVVITPIIIYLAVPVSLNPALLFIPFAMLIGWLMMLISSKFTKYV